MGKARSLKASSYDVYGCVATSGHIEDFFKIALSISSTGDVTENCTSGQPSFF